MSVENFIVNLYGEIFMKSIKNLIDNVNGKVAVPILLYMLGAPGFLVIILWFFFFRGK